jgi:hypothetical protein
LLDGVGGEGGGIVAVEVGGGVDLDAVAGGDDEDFADLGSFVKVGEEGTEVLLGQGESFSYADGGCLVGGADDEDHVSPPEPIK